MTFWADFRHALRLQWKSPGFTTLAVVILALGIGANTVIFTAIESLMLRPLPLREPDRLVFAQQVVEKSNESFNVTWPDYLAWKHEVAAFENLAAFGIDTFNISGGGRAERARGSRVTANFFAAIGIPPMVGRTLAAAEDRPEAPPVVVLSRALAQRRFGAPAECLGRVLEIDGAAHTVIGVMPAEMGFPMGFAELWVPLMASEARHGRGDHFLSVIGRLRKGAGLSEARRAIEASAARMEQTYPESNKDMGVRLMLLSERLASGPRRGLTVLFAAVALVLLLCCANLANLLLARATQRGREMAVRAALGAAPGRLLRQMLTESLLLAVWGGAAGLLMAFWGLDLLSRTLPPIIRTMGGLTIDRFVLAYAGGLSLSTGLLFGIFPAVRGLRAGLAVNLRDGVRAGVLGPRRSRTANALVVAEVAIAVFLLTGAGLLINGLRRLNSMDLGFEPKGVLTAEIAPKSERYKGDGSRIAMVDSLVKRLNAMPGVIAASAVNWPPMTNSASYSYAAEGEARTNLMRPRTAGYRVATAGYLRAMGLRLVRGRFIEDRDTAAAEGVVVVNERLARSVWHGEDPIGKRLALYTDPQRLGRWHSVVGVIAEVRHWGGSEQGQPEFFFPYAQAPVNSFYLAVRTHGEPAAFVRSLESAVGGLDPDLPLSLVRPMERVIADAMAPPRLVASLLTGMSVLAVLLAAMGLYGVISCVVARRTHEIGVRMALGATPPHLLRMVLRQALALIGAGVLLGSIGGLGLTRILRALLFEAIAPHPAIFATVVLVLVVVSLAASWFPLRRVLEFDPVRALRSE